ncbi:MAG: permease-like cell division protein FtsX [Bacteroidales bacterium]|nr:permease-like cell division protein FtsX [Candidatus Hennigimonas equi]
MRKRLVSAYVSSILSISLVLLLVGVASLLLVNAGNVSDYFKENMKLSVIFRPDAREADAKKYFDVLEKKEYVRAVEYVTAEQGMKEMEDLLGSDFLSVFETAPVPVSLNVSLKAAYVTTEAVEGIMKEISSEKIVDDVVWQKSLIEALNSNLRTISLVLGVFIALLLFISFVLIGNTVRLNLYSKRFTIHTMRLVGATKAFIRKPFLAGAVFQGILAAQIATIMLVCALLILKRQFIQMFTIFKLDQLLTVIGIVVLAGVFICLVVTFSVVGKMVSLKKEELYY